MPEWRFVDFHGVLSRAAWCLRAASRLLLGSLIAAFAPGGPVVLSIDDTIERRRGRRILAKGIYRDSVRSSHGHFVKASGLALAQPDAPGSHSRGRVWALPFLTAFAPFERFCREHGRRHKRLTDWARQLVLQSRRWLPGRELVLVGDSGFAALELLAALGRHGVVGVTRLRLDAALYHRAPLRAPGTKGRPRTTGARLPNLSEVLTSAETGWRRVTVPGWYGKGERLVEVCSATAVWRHSGMPVVPIRWVLIRDPRGRFNPQALLCTDPRCSPEGIIGWLVQHWQLEVTFQETRAHLGVETQRQWSDLAISRTTPCLLGLSSLVTVLAARLSSAERQAAATTAWYPKVRPTFRDTLAAVRRHIWHEQGLLTSRRNRHDPKSRTALQRALVYAICHAA
ncbi:hypothetical protein EAH89_18175 [Roseomonas nepalensis]|uniref:Transposase IS701-like DDE domain-containing protein n=1 Tax=Muricoccus nepalensis TaxID=1854500 RepID=A0A502FSU4_9PROT|nr:transposase [Roseomonas nepalensis]TPG52491.1 hypothetical protein EAH89_18175 [Roseomonas nepalensis]